MTNMTLKLTLKSAATFGRGDGVAGLVDREIEQDRDGFPFLRGRTLKGLLAESAENVVYALEKQGQKDWCTTKNALFGKPGRGRDLEERGILRVGDARLPESLRTLVLIERAKTPAAFLREEVEYALTAIRRQTAMNPDGAPEQTTLRAMRVLLRGLVLEASLNFTQTLTAEQEALLAATVLDFRRAGTGRNRGRGWLQADLLNEKQNDMTRTLFEKFVKEVKA
ncbi:hypothetical protein DCC62_00920 [candidate division KSB1 bacterium]|nr:MAG: hypothetical protein DCC62_00920 [candidate division KSB1 bacterium]